jgi:hypothetical protein
MSNLGGLPGGSVSPTDNPVKLPFLVTEAMRASDFLPPANELQKKTSFSFYPLRSARFVRWGGGGLEDHPD